MTVTAINNYQDFKKPKMKIIKSKKISLVKPIFPPIGSFYYLVYAYFEPFLGFLLAYFVGWLFFILGGIVFFIGVFYTYGPIPLSRMPLGEIFLVGQWALEFCNDHLNQQRSITYF